jgi:hypothetical protein
VTSQVRIQLGLYASWSKGIETTRAGYQFYKTRAGYQLEPGWPALLAKTRSWQDGFGIFGEKQGDANVIYVYINEYNKTFVKCSIPLHSWTCLLMTFEWKGDMPLYEL